MLTDSFHSVNKSILASPKKSTKSEEENKTKGGGKGRAVGLFRAVMLSIKCHREIRSGCAGFPFDQTTKPPFQYLLRHPVDILFSLQLTSA